MDRYFLIISCICYAAAVIRSIVALRVRILRRGWFNFIMVMLGFCLQTAFLFLRGRAIGRCPITNLFEVLTFLAWSIALIYLLVGPAYRLSLMGGFTSPLVLLLQITALCAPFDSPRMSRLRPNAWLEFHASVSLIAYGAFALACVAGIMYLLQERQLKTRAVHSLFYQLPPLPNLFAAITRLLCVGFALYTAGLLSGFFTGEPLPRFKIALAVVIWLLYGGILMLRLLRAAAPRRIAAWSVIAFAAALSLLWSIEFVAHRA